MSDEHAEYSTITPSVTVETTVSRPVLTITTTYTVGTPRNGLEKRHYKPKLPACISQCVPNRISSACSSLVVPVSTVTKTRTVQGKVRTVIARPRTTTITRTKSVTFTIPGETTTVIVTAPEQTAIVTRTEDITVTVTSSICPSRTLGAFAIGIVHNEPDSGLYAHVDANNEAECCGACYDNRGCFGWLWYEGFSCTYVYSEQHSMDPDRSCPASLSLILPASGNEDDGVGGRGPCLRS
ncbi:hypothetical protein TWF730_007004 [Orbilia blumenaviensis]|uniref:Apple domain-containing protein n=1 Tax=Orbilia blumenaviensis TaxID=1796055 RepID=A0AAV9VI82_9PEZI